MGVAIDSKRAAGATRAVSESRVEIETRRIGIDFQCRNGSRRFGKNLLPIEISAFATLDQAARRMRNDVDVAVSQNTEQPCGHLLSRLAQTAVKRGYDDVEIRERVVVEIERAVTVNFDLRTSQQPNATSIIRDVDFFSLLPKAFGVEPARNTQAVTMVGNSEETVASGCRCFRHLPD